jgi:hypothetical protein
LIFQASTKTPHFVALVSLKPFLCLWLLVLGSLSTAATINVKNVNGFESIAGDWPFAIGDNIQWALPDFDDSNWETIPLPGDWRNHGYADYFGFA